MNSIQRMTLFKVPDHENQKKLIEAYQKMIKDQTKDGKPYILFGHAAQAKEDPRSKGYTVVARHLFANLDDMHYYDNECPAHAELKKTASGLGVTEPPLVVYLEGQFNAPN